MAISSNNAYLKPLINGVKFNEEIVSNSAQTGIKAVKPPSTAKAPKLQVAIPTPWTTSGSTQTPFSPCVKIPTPTAVSNTAVSPVTDKITMIFKRMVFYVNHYGYMGEGDFTGFKMEENVMLSVVNPNHRYAFLKHGIYTFWLQNETGEIRLAKFTPHP